MYSIIEINGGIGKSIMATAVVKGIKKKYPEREVLVITAYPMVFLNNPLVHKVFTFGACPYFFDDFVKDKNVKFFCDEPYKSEGYLKQEKHLIESWSDILDIESEIQPELFINPLEQNETMKKYAGNKPMLLFQPFGGPVVQGYSWNRDIPYHQAQEIVNKLSSNYNVIQAWTENRPKLEGCRALNIPIRELMVLALHAPQVICIDSFIQHACAAFRKHATVCWITNTPKVFGYDIHKNVFPKEEKTGFVHCMDGRYLEYDFSGSRTYDYPYSSLDIFDVDDIIKEASN